MVGTGYDRGLTLGVMGRRREKQDLLRVQRMQQGSRSVVYDRAQKVRRSRRRHRTSLQHLGRGDPTPFSTCVYLQLLAVSWAKQESRRQAGRTSHTHRAHAMTAPRPAKQLGPTSLVNNIQGKKSTHAPCYTRSACVGEAYPYIITQPCCDCKDISELQLTPSRSPSHHVYVSTRLA